MQTVINMTAILAVTIVSVQTALLLNWAILSVVLKAMVAVRSSDRK